MEKIRYINKNSTTYIDEKQVMHNGKMHKVPIVKFRPFEKIEWVTHGFSTRLGGVSEGIFSEMNLSFSRGDIHNSVMDNHAIMAKALDTDVSECVYSYQTHTTNVLKVTKEHKGMGLIMERDFGEIDGLITNEPGIMLITSYADCVPLYFIDMKNKAIGLSHSGWRGTVNDMAAVTINRMTEEYGSKPSDIFVFIGPSICGSCYEIGEDVAIEFRNKYAETGLVYKDEPVVKEKCEDLVGEIATNEDIVAGNVLSLKSTLPDGARKYYLNLHMANKINMLKAGIREENIYITDICTCCNPKLLFSHRASKGLRGGLCAYLKINSL